MSDFEKTTLNKTNRTDSPTFNFGVGGGNVNNNNCIFNCINCPISNGSGSSSRSESPTFDNVPLPNKNNSTDQ